MSQEVFLELAVSGLASMYPASRWSGSLLRATMDISARSISVADRPHLGQPGHQCSIAPGRPILQSSFTLADLGGNFKVSTAIASPYLSSSHSPCSIWWPFPRPDLRIGEGVARKGGQGWPSRGWRGIHGAARPYLDRPEHDAELKHAGAQHWQSSSSRNRDLWRATPRRCGPVCWRARSPERCGANVSAHFRSKA